MLRLALALTSQLDLRVASIDVTGQSRTRYCERVMRTRLREGRAQVQSMLRGLASMLPVRLLPLFTHAELELMVCGAADIDIDVLRRHTRFGVSVDPSDAHIALLERAEDKKMGRMQDGG